MNASRLYGAILVPFFVVISSTHLLSMQITEANMRQASRDLTTKESDLIKIYLKNKVDQLKQDPFIEAKRAEEGKFEEIFKEFYRGRYDHVLQEISALGGDPQAILQTSKLRTAMLSGKLEQTPWILREIAGLDWFFERDSKRSRKQWPKPQDKLVYLMSLSDELAMNHAKIFDTMLVRDAIDTLEKHINYLLDRAPKTFRARVSETIAKLQKLRVEYNKEGEL